MEARSLKTDFELFAEEIGLTAQILDETQCGFKPSISDASITVKPSGVHGLGVFPGSVFARGFTCGQYVGRAFENGAFTVLGRFANHSQAPNVKAERVSSGNIIFLATEDILPEHEITVNYRDVKKALESKK